MLRRKDIDMREGSLSCPACSCRRGKLLETIVLPVQHGFYSRDTNEQALLNTSMDIPEKTYRMRKCGSCGLEFADPFIAPGSLWYEIVYRILPLYPTARWEFGFLLSRLTSTDLLGEIGCGDGEFLKRCQAAGVSAFGVDFSPAAVGKAYSQGLDAEVLEIGVAPASLGKRQPRDVLAAFQILEHLDQPQALFETARSWSLPGASLWVAIPSDRRPSRFFREADFLDQPPHHMTRWSSSALAEIGKNHGWNLHQVFYEPIRLKARLWWFATRHPVYLAAKSKGRLNTQKREVAIRAMTSLLCLRQAITSRRLMSGQTMLANYTR